MQCLKKISDHKSNHSSYFSVRQLLQNVVLPWVQAESRGLLNLGLAGLRDPLTLSQVDPKDYLTLSPADPSDHLTLKVH
jgi:hypothetical protein